MPQNICWLFKRGMVPMFRQVALGAALLATGMVGSAMAVVVNVNGGASISVRNVTETAPSNLTSAVTTPFGPAAVVPNATTTFVVPVITTTDNDGNLVTTVDPQTVTATFTAETFCGDGTAASTGFCLLTIVAVGPAPAATRAELNPQSNINDGFATNINLNTTIGDFKHHSIQRARRFTAPGTYTIQVERRIQAVVGTTSFSLSDWIFNVEVSD
jgi:hypothetical protein